MGIGEEKMILYKLLPLVLAAAAGLFIMFGAVSYKVLFAPETNQVSGPSYSLDCPRLSSSNRERAD